MFAYIVRRTVYGVFIVLGVLFFLFLLFFALTRPEDIARRALGEKAMPAVIAQWKKNHGYDKPRWPGPGHMANNLLVEHYRKMLTFDFGRSDIDDAPILQRIDRGAWPSLALSIPDFLVGTLVGILLSLFVAFFRETYIDTSAMFLSVLGMSLSILLYIIGAQFLIGKALRWFPISGFDPSPAVLWRFVAMPVIVGVAAGLGGTIRFYRTVFVEEIYRDYVRTARAKGAGEMRIMINHVMRNAMIPIMTDIVMAIPFLFMGALIMESFFGIPGLGALTVEAIDNNDFSTLRVVVYIGSLLFVLGQILTDISYTLVDPRVRLE